MRNLILTLVLTSTLFTTGFAQNANWCGTEISQEWMEAFYQRDKSHLTHKAGNYPADTIPIIYHIVGDNNGNGYFELNDLFRSHCELYDLFLDADIYFYILDIRYINNTNAYQNDDTYQLFSQNNRDACNVYVVNQMAGVCGYSFVPENWDGSGWHGPNRGGIVLAQNCMAPGNTTYRHEMGHYLNLPHTFYGWEGQNPPGAGQNAPSFINGSPVENADGSNCYASGDGFCDTPPDYLSDRWACNFDRNYTDPLGNTFTVDERNFMSYSSDGCSNYLKDEQLAEVNAAPRDHRPYLLNLPVPEFDIFSSITGLVPAANTSGLNPSDILVSWNSIPNADYYHVQIAEFNFVNPSFDVVLEDTFFIITNPSVNSSYDWRVKPISLTNVCSPFTPIVEFSTASYTASLQIQNATCIGDANGSVEISVPNTDSYDYYWSAADPVVDNTIQGVNSDVLDNLPTGAYSVIVVRNNSDTLISAFNIGAANEISIEINQVGTDLIANVSGGTPPFTFVWNDGTESTTLSNPAGGDYTFVVIDQNGCQKTATATYTEVSTGVNDNNIIEELVLAPNPLNHSNLTLTSTLNNSGTMFVTVTDLSGKTLLNDFTHAKFGKNVWNLNLDNLSNGVYIVNTTINGYSRSSKLLMQK